MSDVHLGREGRHGRTEELEMVFSSLNDFCVRFNLHDQGKAIIISPTNVRHTRQQITH